MSDPDTIRVYDARAREYADVTASDGPDATLSTFIARLPQGGAVLDLGCGPGASAGHMAAAGLAVDAWDASSEMVAIAATLPGVSARQALFSDLAADAAYDGIWANFSLLHAPRDEMPAHLEAIKRALKPGGLFHIALKEGDGQSKDPIGRTYTYYTAETLGAALRAAGLEPGEWQRGRDRGLDGRMADWISTTAHA